MIATLLRTAQRYRDCGGRCDGCSCCADQDATAIGATATFTLAGDAHTDPAVLGVKGSRVQISLARHHDGGFTPLRRQGRPGNPRGDNGSSPPVLMASTRWRRCSSATVSAIHVSAVCRTQPLRKGASSRSLPRGPRGGLGRREPPHPRCQLLERAGGGAPAKVAVDWVGRSGTVMIVAATREAMRSARVSHQLALLAPRHQPRSSGRMWPQSLGSRLQRPEASMS